MMLKILIITDFTSLLEELQLLVTHAGIAANFTMLSTTDDILKAIASGEYDFIISDYTVGTLDIWKIANFTCSKRLVTQPVALILLKENCDTHIPSLLANEYHFKVAELTEVPALLQLSEFDFRPSLLIIEDDYHAANSAMHALKDNFTVMIAYDGGSGLQCWREHRHHVVLLDLMLPDMMGDFVLDQILSVDDKQAVVMVTAFSSLENHKDLLLSGATDFLAKPYLINDLREMCANALMRATLNCQSYYYNEKQIQISRYLDQCELHLHQGHIRECRDIFKNIRDLIPNILTFEDSCFSSDQSE